MTMATFTFTPDFPATESSRPRVNSMAVPSFEQRTTFGINPLVDTWDLTFGARTQADRDSIYAFLAARRGVEPFQWTTPFGETGSWVCPRWDTRLDSCGLNTVQASFELQYVPGGPNLTLPAAPTGAFTWVPEFQAQLGFDARARAVAYGDGYQQRYVFGLLPQEESWRLTFDYRTNAERDLIRGYLRGAKGTTAFSWTDPRSGVTGRYVCSEWSVQYQVFNNSSIQAVFRRVFEP